jgi:hypothetical protein
MAYSSPDPLRWIGGANLPTLRGSRVNATLPFAELKVGDGYVELRLRGPIPRLWRPETLVAKPGDLDLVWPIGQRRRLSAILRMRGVGFRRSDGHEWYFGTAAGQEILGVLEGQGFPVTRESGSARKVWRGDP